MSLTSYSNLQTENQERPQDGTDTTDEWISNIHGISGGVPIQLPGFSLPADSRIINVTAELPDEFVRLWIMYPEL
jgi:hypothetical protein